MDGDEDGRTEMDGDGWRWMDLKFKEEMEIDWDRKEFGNERR